MGEERVAARDLPFQIIAQGIRFNGQQEQVILPCEVFRGRFCRLGRSREMDITICHIDGGTGGFALRAQGGPFVGSENFEYQHGKGDAFAGGYRQEGPSSAFIGSIGIEVREI